MAIQSKTILKSYFETNDYPTQSQFSDLIDSAARINTFHIDDYGATGKSFTNDNAGFAAAKAAAEAQLALDPYSGAIIELGPKHYYLSGTYTITASRLVVRGQGKDITKITTSNKTTDLFVTSNGATSVIEAGGYQGFTIYYDKATYGATVSAVGILMEGVTKGILRDVEVQNMAYGCVLYGNVNLSHENFSVTGAAADGCIAGLVLRPKSSSVNLDVVDLPTQIHIRGYNCLGALAAGPSYGVIIYAGEQVEFSDYYIGNCAYYNVLIEQNATIDKNILEVTFGAGYIDGAGLNSVHITGAAASGNNYIGSVHFTSGCTIKGQAGTSLHGLYVDGTARAGTYTQACRGLMVVGAAVIGHDGDGINLQGGVGSLISSSRVSGCNYFNGTGTRGSTGGVGVRLGANTSYSSVTVNRIGGDGDHDASTSYQERAILVENGATHYHIFGNFVAGNKSGNDPILDNGVSYNVSTNISKVQDNTGDPKPDSSITPSVPADNVVFYNPLKYQVEVSVFGGTVTDIAVNGQTIASATGVKFNLAPEGFVKLRYSSAPSWVWYALN